MKCELCDGALLLNHVEPDATTFEIEVAMYVCAKCGHGQSRRAPHDPYTARVARGVSHGG